MKERHGDEMQCNSKNLGGVMSHHRRLGKMMTMLMLILAFRLLLCLSDELLLEGPADD
jgi:hypothetical protein